MSKITSIFFFFKIPLVVAVGIIAYLFLMYVFAWPLAASLVAVLVVIFGSFDLISDTASSLIHKQFALDYIALLAIVTALATRQYLVAAIITLMLSGGNTLEEYAMALAKQSLTSLADRIPHQVNVWLQHEISSQLAIEKVKVGQEIAVRKGEVIPLDGKLLSEQAEIDESSLTGEPYSITKEEGEEIRSGTVNVGDLLVLQVTKTDKDSTYRQIVKMVKEAQNDKSPMIRMANRYSTFFTLVTLALASFAFLLSHDWQRVLAVLVIATPCPLILATPIAMIGGVNSAARRKIIIKRLASLEVLAKVQTLMFDKTGTITLGKPRLKEIEVLAKGFDQGQILSVAAAIERNSLHPLARAIVSAAREQQVVRVKATNIKEIVGQGIGGEVDGKKYSIKKTANDSTVTDIWLDEKKLARLVFEDQLKPNSLKTLKQLQAQGLQLWLLTGDQPARAAHIVKSLGIEMQIKANASPEDKKNVIRDMKKQGKITAMIGDGINDAPALALADVGMVFSNQQQTASSEAADMVFLNGNLEAVTDALSISQRTTKIALQSIIVGIGLSIVGMTAASFGLIVPVVGAFLQEFIDVGVILNALRASRD